MSHSSNEEQPVRGQPPNTDGYIRPGKGTRRRLEPESIQSSDRDAKCHKAFSKGVKRPANITLGDEPVVFKRPTRLGPVLTRRFCGDSASASASAFTR